MNRHEQTWLKLAALARRVPPHETALSAPPGFATRVVARALSNEPPMQWVFERLSWRALGVATLLAALCVVAHYSLLGGADEEWPVDENPAALEVDLNS